MFGDMGVLMKKKHIDVVLDEELYKELKEAAKQDARSMNSYINVVIRRSLIPVGGKSYAH
jgi:hypothetical protein